VRQSDRLLILICSMLAAGVIAWQGLSGTDLYVALLQASPESRGQLLRSPVIAQSSNGTLSFDLVARLGPGVTGVLFVDIRAEWSAKYTPQDGVYRVEGDVVRGVIQLGSATDPVRYASRYYFRLRDVAGNVYIDGSIVVQGYRLATTLTTAAAWIGLVASILQVLLVIWESVPRGPVTGWSAAIRRGSGSLASAGWRRSSRRRRGTS
jgi:hypothetical protein